MAAPNPHQAAARIRKAAAIAALLIQHGITARDAAGLMDHQWAMVAQAAQVNAPSPTTRLLVVAILSAAA
jgi:hypothetical protein